MVSCPCETGLGLELRTLGTAVVLRRARLHRLALVAHPHEHFAEAVAVGVRVGAVGAAAEVGAVRVVEVHIVAADVTSAVEGVATGARFGAGALPVRVGFGPWVLAHSPVDAAALRGRWGSH